jgi:hypothetical protein
VAPPRVHVYIDETGDRGGSADASPIFGMAAIVLDDDGVREARAAADQLRADFKVPADKVLSWKSAVKTHDRRRRAAEILSDVSGLQVCYVYTVKAELRLGSYRDNPQRLYNYVAYKTYKASLWAARAWKGGSAEVWTRFGHVVGHDHRTTEAYIHREAARDPRVPFGMEQGRRWVSADLYAESQVADLYAGFLKAALWPGGEFGYVEPSYLLRVWPQIVNSDQCAVPLGIMSMPSNDLIRRQPWFPCGGCT